MKNRNIKILILGASSDIGVELIKILDNPKIEIGAHCHSNKKILEKFKNSRLAKFKIFKKKLINQKQSHELVSSYIKWSGGIDVLVQLTGNISKIKDWTDLKQKNLIRDFNINFSSTFFIVQKIFKHMKKSGGKIILTSTSSAIHGGGEDSFAYGLSKLNLLYLSKAIARFGGKYNIISNCISPGYIDTQFHTKVMKRSKKDLKIRQAKSKLGRSGSPQEIAEFINFLISNKSNYFTGQNLNIDGGDWI